MQKTIGGDRLGSGKKMKVELHGYQRSTHDLGNVWRSTMAAGTLVPFMKLLVLPGDTFDIDLNADVKTHPTVGPLFGSYKVQLDIFQCPLRLYQGKLHNNKLGIGLKMSTVKLPVINMEAPNINGADLSKTDIDNMQIHPSSIFSYLGIRGVGIYQEAAGDPFQIRYFNAIPWLGYWDIYKNYYSNKQEEIGAVIHNAAPIVDENVTEILYNPGGIVIEKGIAQTTGPQWLEDPAFLLTLENNGTVQDTSTLLVWVSWNTGGTGGGHGEYIPFDNIFTLTTIAGVIQSYVYNGSLPGIDKYIWAWEYTSNVASPVIDVVTFPLTDIDDMREEILTRTTDVLPVVLTTAGPEPYALALKKDAIGYCMSRNQEGLGLKTYQSDLLNNWLSTEWIDGANGISEITAVDTSGGSFTMDTIVLAKKVYDMLNRIAISGGTYDDWLDAVYTHDRYTRCETPVYLGGLIKELVFQEVVSTGSGVEADPLGTLAGKGVMSHKNKGGKVTVRVDEPSYIIGIVSITPRLDYSQGNDWDIHLETMDDLHKPALDEIGFQELITEQMAWWDTHWDVGQSKWITRSAGKQPAWINYMTAINETRGNFAIKDNEMFMTLNRSYETEITNPGTTNEITIKDLTTYIDPRIYNQIFADTALDSQNFWVQIGKNITGRRKLSAKLMPNL